MTSSTYEQSDILFTIFNLCFWLNDIVFEATTTAVPIEADLTTTAGSTDDDDVTISTTNDTNTVTQATTEQASTDTTTTSQTDIETARPTTSATATLTDEEYEDDTFYGTDLPDVTSTLSREFEFEAFLWGTISFLFFFLVCFSSPCIPLSLIFQTGPMTRQENFHLELKRQMKAARNFKGPAPITWKGLHYFLFGLRSVTILSLSLLLSHSPLSFH